MMDAEIKRLVKFYEKVEREIIRQVTGGLLKGGDANYLHGMLRNVQAILNDLRAGSLEWCEEAIPRIYTDGVKIADMQIELSGEAVVPGFGAIHQQAAQVLAENTFGRFNDVADFIGRRVDDIYRNTALESIRGGVVGYETWQEVAGKYREQLLEQGITGFRDRADRKWNMGTYAEMVARTSTMECHLEGTKNRLLEQGHDLVEVTSHHGACSLCQPWQGKILSLTGKTPGYPTLDEAKAAGLFHPRCRHAYGLYIDLDKEIERLEAELTEVELTTDAPDLDTWLRNADKTEEMAWEKLEKGAMLENAPEDWRNAVERQVSLEEAADMWSQTWAPKEMNKIVAMIKSGELDRIPIGTYNEQLSAIRTARLFKAANTSRLEIKRVQRIISERDKLWSIKVGEKGEFPLVSFSKVNFLKGEEAGTYSYIPGKRKVVIFENPSTGLDIEDYATRDIREREVILSGGFRVINVEGDRIYLSR